MPPCDLLSETVSSGIFFGSQRREVRLSIRILRITSILDANAVLAVSKINHLGPAAYGTQARPRDGPARNAMANFEEGGRAKRRRVGSGANIPERKIFKFLAR